MNKMGDFPEGRGNKKFFFKVWVFRVSPRAPGCACSAVGKMIKKKMIF